MLRHKKILLAVTGSISAYKAAFLVRLLVKNGAEVKVLMTVAAKDFITPLTLSTLSKNPVYSSYYKTDNGEWNNHVELGLWADLLLVAPASANTLAKMANGICDNLVMGVYLSAKCPVFFAPAMDLDMYAHPTTKTNIDRLISFGNKLIHPENGELASGLSGEGRMAEPEDIIGILSQHFGKKKSLIGKRVLVTAGPTYEAIDPVRFIGNHSSGKMGFAIANELSLNGAIVTLVAGPVGILELEPGIKRIDVLDAEAMHKACEKEFKKSDIAILSAAVADFKPIKTSNQKIKKGNGLSSIELKPTNDILESLGKVKTSKQLLIGFALETENEAENAKQKIRKKNLDFIVLNSLNDKGAGFKNDTNKITIIHKDNKSKSFELKSKAEVAKDIVNEIIKLAK